MFVAAAAKGRFLKSNIPLSHLTFFCRSRLSHHEDYVIAVLYTRNLLYSGIIPRIPLPRISLLSLSRLLCSVFNCTNVINFRLRLWMKAPCLYEMGVFRYTRCMSLSSSCGALSLAGLFASTGLASTSMESKYQTAEVGKRTP